MTNTIRKLILDWDAKHNTTADQTLNDAEEIYKADIGLEEGDIYDHEDFDNEDFRDVLRQLVDERWQQETSRGYDFIKYMETQKDVCWYDIICAIDDMYDYFDYKYDLNEKHKLDGKLDVIYYYEACEYLL